MGMDWYYVGMTEFEMIGILLIVVFLFIYVLYWWNILNEK
jgi:uncharacterized membrane protein YdbT with pleckstrin-like domain